MPFSQTRNAPPGIIRRSPTATLKAFASGRRDQSIPPTVVPCHFVLDKTANIFQNSARRGSDSGREPLPARFFRSFQASIHRLNTTGNGERAYHEIAISSQYTNSTD